MPPRRTWKSAFVSGFWGLYTQILGLCPWTPMPPRPKPPLSSPPHSKFLAMPLGLIIDFMLADAIAGALSHDEQFANVNLLL